MAGAEARFRGYLAERGLRCTAPRLHVLNVALRRAGHFEAEDLYEGLREGGRSASRATVYRTLVHLTECGLIKEALRSEGRARYEGVYGIEHHDHMVCAECGRVIEFCDEMIEELQERVCRRHGFRPLEHRMAIRGICRECRGTRKRRDE